MVYSFLCEPGFPFLWINKCPEVQSLSPGVAAKLFCTVFLFSPAMPEEPGFSTFSPAFDGVTICLALLNGVES